MIESATKLLVVAESALMIVLLTSVPLYHEVRSNDKLLSFYFYVSVSAMIIFAILLIIVLTKQLS